MEDEHRKNVTVVEAADYLGLTRGKVKEMVDRGILKADTFAGAIHISGEEAAIIDRETAPLTDSPPDSSVKAGLTTLRPVQTRFVGCALLGLWFLLVLGGVDHHEPVSPDQYDQEQGQHHEELQVLHQQATAAEQRHERAAKADDHPYGSRD